MAILDELDWFILPHLAYSLIWHPVIFGYSHTSKDFLDEQHFASDLQEKQAVTKFFHNFPTSFYATGIEHLVDQYEKCLNFDSDLCWKIDHLT